MMRTKTQNNCTGHILPHYCHVSGQHFYTPLYPFQQSYLGLTIAGIGFRFFPSSGSRVFYPYFIPMLSFAPLSEDIQPHETSAILIPLVLAIKVTHLAQGIFYHYMAAQRPLLHEKKGMSGILNSSAKNAMDPVRLKIQHKINQSVLLPCVWGTFLYPIIPTLAELLNIFEHDYHFPLFSSSGPENYAAKRNIRPPYLVNLTEAIQQFCSLGQGKENSVILNF